MRRSPGGRERRGEAASGNIVHLKAKSFQVTNVLAAKKDRLGRHPRPAWAVVAMPTPSTLPITAQ